MKPITAFKSILNCRCPRCRNGKVFTYSNPYSRKFTDIESKCGNCRLTYEMEQGFWYGAMYISYAFGVAIAIPIMVLLSYLTELKIYEISFIVMLVLIIAMPLLFRYSRIVWLHIFVRLDKGEINKTER